MRRWHGMGLIFILATGPARAQDGPRVTNPGFEADRYAQSPGYSAANGGTITGWKTTGNVGINPVFLTNGNSLAPFADNGRVPEGEQVLFMQNECTVSQPIDGFVKGKTYRVQYRENGRAFNRSTALPKLRVLLGGTVVVSPHEVPPVCPAEQRDLPFARVVSAEFNAPADGPVDLVFETLTGGGVSVLIDAIEISEAAPAP